jgi:hypothetical protein
MNRIPDNPTFPPGQAIAMGAAFVVFGSIPVLAALDVIPVSDTSFHVPRWLVAVVTACFPAAGIWMLFNGVARLIGKDSPAARVLDRIGYGCLAIVIVAFIGGLAIFFTWELISPFPGAGQGVEIMGVAFAPDSFVGKVGSRLGAAIGALIFDGILLGVAWVAIRDAFKGRDKP